MALDLTLFQLTLMTLGIIPLAGNIFNMIFISRRGKLRAPMYYIMINIAIADTLFILLKPMWAIHTTICNNYKAPITYSNNTIANSTYCDDEAYFPYQLLLKLSFITSIFSTVLLAIDRYIAIRYCLLYYQNVTKKKLLAAFLLTWFIAFLTVFFPVRKGFTIYSPFSSVEINDHVVACTLLIISVVIVIAIAIYTNRIRRQHIKRIKRQHSVIGREAHVFTILRQLKQSLKDTLRLYIVTAVFTCLHVLSLIIRKISGHSMGKVLGISALLYMIINPYLLIFIMTDLRVEHKKFWGKFFPVICKGNSVKPTPGDEAITSANGRVIELT